MATSDKYFEVHQHSVPIALESMTCFGQQIFLTTATGHLLTYFVAVAPKIELTLLKHDHNFATDRVICIGFSTGFSVYDVNSYKLLIML